MFRTYLISFRQGICSFQEKKQSLSLLSKIVYFWKEAKEVRRETTTMIYFKVSGVNGVRFSSSPDGTQFRQMGSSGQLSPSWLCEGSSTHWIKLCMENLTESLRGTMVHICWLHRLKRSWRKWHVLQRRQGWNILNLRWKVPSQTRAQRWWTRLP